MAGFAESEVEQATLGWLQEIGWSVLHGPDIAPDTPDSERADYGDVVLALPRLRQLSMNYVDFHFFPRPK